MMAHSFTPAAIPIPSRTKPSCHLESQPSLSFNGVCACIQNASDKAPDDTSIVRRRSVAWGLVGVVMGVNWSENGGANAARRPPPPPPAEKKDPSITGLAAKVLASKKRKEAMKEDVAKLREKGTTVVQEQSQ